MMAIALQRLILFRFPCGKRRFGHSDQSLCYLEAFEDMTLTKADLVHKVYEAHDLTKVQATDAVEIFLSISKRCLEKGDDLLLSGFGKFNVKEKKARRGRNPQTGDALMLDARTVVTFKPSGILRDRINGDVI